MPTVLLRVRRFIRAQLTGWQRALAIALLLFLSSWVLMALAEPADNDISRPGNYWWYFVVTAATVGYGDFFPTTTAGRAVGAYVIVGGIVTLTLLFTSLADYIASARSRRLKGAVAVDLDDHVVVLGYTSGRTERIVEELTSEGRLQVVVCAWDDVLEQHPMPERPQVQFVRGDLTNSDVMERACVGRARTAIIDGRDDNESLAIAVAVDHVKPDIHMVVALRDLRRREHLGYVNPRVQCAQWHLPFLLTEEALDPGITQVYNDLMSSGGHGNSYSMRVPAGFPHGTVGDCQTWLGRTFGATLLAVRTDGDLVVSPPWDAPITPGALVYYVGRERIDSAQLTGR